MRERTLVGLFVLIAGALLVGTIVAVSGGIGVTMVPHRAYFKFAGGVQAGAPVRYGGMTVGKVTKVRVDPGNTTRIEIQFVVSKDAPIKTDSVAKIATLGPLSDNYIEVTTGTLTAPPAPSGSVLASSEMFGLPQLGDAVQGMLPDAQKAMQSLNENLDQLKVTLNRANDLLSDRNRANIGGSIEKVNRLLADVQPKVNQSLDNLNGMLGDARPKVSTTLTSVQELTAKMNPLLDDVRTTTARANDTLSHVDATLVENRADIRTVVTNLRDTLAKSGVLLDQLNSTLDQNSPNIDELLENLRLATENLRGLTETLRSSPAVLIRGMKVRERSPGEVQ